MIDLDYTHPKLWDYQIKTLVDWAGIVDGFRCDVAPMVPVAFWERARAEVSAVRKDAIWLAESVESVFLLHLRSRGITALSDSEIFRAFDISYDYDIYRAFTDYVCGKAPLSHYLEAVQRQEWIYPDNYCKLRFLENHDQSRAHFLIPEKKALENFTAFSFFQKGTAFVYAGQEFMATHLPSLFDRDTVSMTASQKGDLSALIKQLSAIKKDPLFADSTYEVKDAGNDICVATHTHGDRMALGVFSLKGAFGTVPVCVPDGIYQNEITGEKTEVFHGCLRCDGTPIILFSEE